MSGRPPRAGTRSEGKRARTRGATQSDRTAGRTGQRAVPRANERASERSIERPSDPGGERTSDRAIDLALDKLERRSRPPASEPVGRSRPGPPGPIDPVDLIEVVVEGEHGEQDRAPSVGTDQFVRVADDAVVEVTDLAEPPQLRLLVLEAAPQLAAAAAAIAAAGHVVVAGASGATGVERLRAEVGGVDALLVGLPGGEPLIDAALSLGAARPVVIASSAGSALDAVRRATGSGADLATVRPHEIERLAPVLLAAARLVEQRRGIDPAATAPDLARGAALPELRDLREPRDLAGTGEALGGTGHPESGAALGGAGLVAPGAALEGAELEDPGAALEGEPGGDLDVLLDELSDREPGALQPLDVFQRAMDAELERARRYGYSLALAIFGLDIAPEPPPGVRGIVRARAGNALVNAIRDVDLVTELDHDRFLVLMPYSDRVVASDLGRRIISAVAAADPVTAAGRTFPPRVIGAIVEVRTDETPPLSRLVQDAVQLLEQAFVTGASLAVES